MQTAHIVDFWANIVIVLYVMVFDYSNEPKSIYLLLQAIRSQLGISN